MDNRTLNDYKNNIYSQYGEDGIIQEIFRRLSISKGTCVEFGAWDGLLLSNTAVLWTKHNWKAVLIEADEDKFSTLKKMIKGYDCIPVKEFVTPLGKSSIENILKKENVPFDEVKFLSIDIDGNEYHIINGLTTLRPPLIVAEYNPTIPPELDIISKEDAFFGSSALELTKLMEEKNYFLAAMTKSNCFFIDKKFSELFSDLNTDFNVLFDRSCLTYYITGYKGAYAFSQYPAYGLGLPLNPQLIEKGELYFQRYSEFKVRLIAVKHFIKMRLKSIIGVNNIYFVKEWTKYIVWKLKGMPVPAHGKYKWRVLKNYGKKHNIDTFVETGTAGGGTIIEMAKYFKQLYTIELFPMLHHIARIKDTTGRVTFLEGDSGVKMKEVLEKINEPALFWLDAHYSGDGTARGISDTPIVLELQTIFKHKNRKHVIVIDDMRDFNGTNGYPQLSELIQYIKQNAPWYQVKQDNDLLIIEPAK
jgi:hypothetical protein